MKVRVLLFAQLSEIFGCSDICLQVPEGSRLADLPAHLTPKQPCPLPPIQYAVNYEQAAPGTLLHAGDEVALLPPVAGG